MRLINFLFWTVIEVTVFFGWMYVMFTDNWKNVPILNRIQDKGDANIIILVVATGLFCVQIWSLKLYKRGKMHEETEAN